ncbi:armadillo-type protein [Limtongia smithiae]|uniref:armadillo-type protein n=1 Tax=Limtongia smithiae TaxID=1125753 RepID=UPI0034CDADEA
MSAMDNFDLSEHLNAYLTDPASLVSDDDFGDEPAALLDAVTEAISLDTTAVLQSNSFEVLEYLLIHYPQLSPAIQAGLTDLIISSLSAQADVTSGAIEADEHELFSQQKRLLEVYSFLAQWAIAAAEHSRQSTVYQQSRSKGKNPNSEAAQSNRAVAECLVAALQTICKVQKLKLTKLFMTTSERDLFISLFTRPAYLILEDETNIKNATLKMHVFKSICLAIKYHGHAFGAQTTLIQDLTYYDHLSETIAELLQILYEQYDYAQLSDDILRELSNKEFNSNDTKGPKSVSAFLVKFSELLPKLMVQKMSYFVRQLDSDSYALRCALIEVCGNLIVYLFRQEDVSGESQNQINSFFDILEERFLDINPYCRSKTVQMLIKLCELDIKFLQRRQTITSLAIQSLEDKSSFVRRNAIKLISRLMSTHPFSVMHGGQLPLKLWQERLDAVNAELKKLLPPIDEAQDDVHEPGDLSRIDDGLLDEPSAFLEEADINTDALQRQADQIEAINMLKLTKQYYTEAISFIKSLHEASGVICSLLSSKNKSEVIEAMDFFVAADAYKLDTAKLGVRKMLHLIWTKANNDEGRGIQTHLVECYATLFFTAPDGFSNSDKCTFIARNLISLTYGATAAEMTSLERLLFIMMKASQMPELVIEKLWQVYGVQQRDISKAQRRGAIIILGMLGAYDSNIVSRELETIYHIGLGMLGGQDLVLAKYSCVALQRVSLKFENEHAIFLKLASILCMYSESPEWYALAEQALNALCALAKRPDVICAKAIREKTRAVFGNHLDAVTGRKQSATCGLSQLLFLVGHTAIKEIVLMESYENEFKRRKMASEKNKEESANSSRDEMDLIGGTSEDDFTEAMGQIRERELLYDDMALLSRFGKLVTEICSDNLNYNDPRLQISATLCLAKFMCVSAAYCEDNLPLLLTILEKSRDPVTRSNIVIALGDMAVCFNHIIDENTDFLYRRLHDPDSTVQRTCLMTLTFLILAGQVKVKKQLGEMAKCLEDDEKSIVDLAKMFFTELARKDNAIYNAYTDIFSTLSADEGLPEDSFKKILKFLSSFIEKEKHAKQLAEKLAVRLPRCDNEKQWNEVTYALSLLPHKNEQIQKVVAEGFKVVASAA